MKTLKDLTPEIIEKIEVYKSKVRDHLYSGEEHLTNKREDTVDYIEYVYNLADQEKPVVLIADNPDVYKIWFVLLNTDFYLNKIDKLFTLKNNKENKEIDFKLYSELYTELKNEIGLKLDSTVNTNLKSELNEELLRELKLLHEANIPVSTEINSIKEKELNDEFTDKLKTTKVKSHWFTFCNIYTRVFLTWYKFIMDEFNLEFSKKEELNYMYNLINKTYISRCYFTKGYVLVLRTPSRIIRNEIGFHSVHEAAIQFKGNYNMYYVNGRKVSEDIIKLNFTFEDFLKEENEDIKAAMLTVIKEKKGQEELLKFLQAELIDEKEIKHSSGHTEIVRLYKTKEKYSFLQDRHGNMNQPYCWSEMTCPSTGSIYLIENSADFTDAIEAMKFLRPSFIPNELKYDFTKFNN
jgi:hypothetical protein